MIASSDSHTSDITDTTSSGDTGYPVYKPYIEEKEIEEEISPLKVDVFKANNRNIIRQNRFNSKRKFRIHRTRNR